MYKYRFKKIYESTEIGYWTIGTLFKINNFLKYNIQSDERILKKRFFSKFNRKLDLQNPSTLNEKIVWLKLNDRTPLHTLCADKYEVRKYIKKNIG